MNISSEHLIFWAVLVPSVILHEVSHGWTALAFGDDTAKRAGRLTLNPLRHVDPFGTLILPALLVFTTGTAFGYAKPVPVNVGNLRNPRQQSLFVSLAGPAVNIVLAVAAAVAASAAGVIGLPDGSLLRPEGLWPQVLVAIGVVNVILAVFNLIPIPPLDGSAIIERVLPMSWWPRYLRLRQYSMGLLLLVVLVVPGVLTGVLLPAVKLWGHLL